MKKFLHFAMVCVGLMFSKAQTSVTASNYATGQNATYTFNYTTTQAIGTGTANPNVFYFSKPGAYPSLTTVSGGNNLDSHITFKVNGVTYPCNITFGSVGGSWSSGIQLSTGGATTGIAIPAGAQIQVTVTGLLKNPSTSGTYNLNWITAKANGAIVESFSFPVTIASTLAATEVSDKKDEAKIYPNPASEFIKVSGLKKNEKYTIFSVSGEKISEGLVSVNEQINIQHLNKGLFLLKLENGQVSKFIKK
ncbi:T9SS type A sorting domain-containing protein [Chryseobacterium sp. POE27]|uniref:T9SS type A sorting domain-containing protein n=1 Tax=Chryseobacterium sp. POE27 TaxID=3138177 RepID=UPI00321A478D